MCEILTLIFIFLPGYIFYKIIRYEIPNSFQYFEWFRFVLNLMIFFLVLFCVVYMNRYDINTIDDVQQPFFYNILGFPFQGAIEQDIVDLSRDNSFTTFFKNLSYLIKTADHGRYISWIVMHFVVDGSSVMFSQHPVENFYPIFMRGFIFALLFYLIARTAYYTTSQKKLSPLLFISVSLFLLSKFSGASFAYHNQCFAYLMNLCLFFYPFFLITQCFFYNSNFFNKKVLITSVWGLILGLSAHFNFITMFGIILFLTVVSFIKTSEKKIFINNIFRINIIIPIISFILGIFCSVFSKHFLYLFLEQRTPKEGKITFLREHFFDCLYDLMLEYKIYHKIEFYLILVLTIVSIIILIRNRKIWKNIILAYSLIFGNFLFNFSLILCGKPVRYNLYWFTHHDLRYITSIFLTISILILVSGFFSISDFFKKKIILIIGELCLIIYSLNALISHQAIPFQIANKFEKYYTYQMEKAMIFYANRGSGKIYYPKNPTLPGDCARNRDWLFVSFANYFWRNYKIDIKKIPLEELSEINFLKKAQRDGLYFSKHEFEQINFNYLMKYKVNFGDMKCYPIK